MSTVQCYFDVTLKANTLLQLNYKYICYNKEIYVLIRLFIICRKVFLYYSKT